MRHNVASKHFSRNANQRQALFKGLIISLLEHERIETTITKAKEIRRHVERMVTLGKRGDLHAKRIAISKVANRKVVAKLFAEIAPRFTERNGGYLRIIKTAPRLKDQAPMAIIEFVDFQQQKELNKNK
jgi:large subunit ribosomal protein L17